MVMLLLDGGMGHELKLRGVKQPPGWEGWFVGGALANRDDPGVVRALHEEYLMSGADVITTNNFVVTEHTLGKVFGEHEGAAMLSELTRASAAVAAEARDACAAKCGGRKLLIAGSLPPLRESYEPLSSALIDDARRQYDAIASALADTCDVLLCETMASSGEGRAAASAASRTGLPVWVAWTLEDTAASRLRSGEALSTALDVVRDVRGLAAVMANCSAPFAIGAALPLLAVGAPHGILVGGYGNGFRQTTSEWKAAQEAGGAAAAAAGKGGDEAAGVRACCAGVHSGDAFDESGIMTPECYADHAERWVKEGGASVVGGCCGIGPAHIRAISQRRNRQKSGGGGLRSPP